MRVIPEQGGGDAVVGIVHESMGFFYGTTPVVRVSLLRE
jgi:hypothetical protein